MDHDLTFDEDEPRDESNTGAPTTPENELRTLRHRAHELEHQLRRCQQTAALLEAQLEKTKETLSFRLGYLLIHSPKSWTALRRLPRDLLELQREAKRRRQARNSPDAIASRAAPRAWRLPEHFAEDAFRVFVAQGLAAAEAYVESTARDDRERARAWL
jgi:hypothetical protein